MRASRDRLKSSPVFPRAPTGDRAGHLAILAHTKRKSAKTALAPPAASPRIIGSRSEQSLATLRDMLRRLIGEASAARKVDLDRAAVLADAIGDLRLVIARLELEVYAPPVGESRPTAAVFGIRPCAAAPRAGDILIKGVTTEYFELVEITTGRVLSGPLHGFPVALAAARARHPGAIWQQHSDERGRPLTDPFRLPVI
jgi:hypothetical protein